MSINEDSEQASQMEEVRQHPDSEFVLQSLGTEQFLSPVVQTHAIKELTSYMKNWFTGKVNHGNKPTCVTCFDVSGTGKTTTIKEAARNLKSIHCHINLVDNDLFTAGLFKSCEEFGERQNPPKGSDDFVCAKDVEKFFVKRFDAVLITMFESIIEQCEQFKASDLDHEGEYIKPSMPKYNSPKTSPDPMTTPSPIDTSKIAGLVRSSAANDTYKKLVNVIKPLKHLLVIHLDDCQLFFCGLTKKPNIIDGSIQTKEVMSMALRLFSRQVYSLGSCQEILWVYSGTRPNLNVEMRVASKYGRSYNVAKSLLDFNVSDILKILSKYFRLDENDPVLKNKCENLCGPPKFLYWFIEASEDYVLNTAEDLIESWENIETDTLRLYRGQITQTIESFNLSTSHMKIYARNLCVLYTHIFMNNVSGFFEFDELPSQWMPFIEAGLLRIREGDKVWKMYRPNRFLVKIFNSYVGWFNWNNVDHLISNIKASEATPTLKGKVFEFLFALELCSTSDSKLWDLLASEMNIHPKLDWEPSLELISEVKRGMDQSKIHIMKDPDCSASKTDVVFFAQQVKRPREDPVTVRVLCQLTTQSESCKAKAKETLLAMQRLKDDLTDYRVFLSPNSRGSLVDLAATARRVTRHEKVAAVVVPVRHDEEMSVKHTNTLEATDLNKDQSKTKQPVGQLSLENCFWLDSTKLVDGFYFSPKLCDPKQSEEFLGALMDFAKIHDSSLAEKISLSFTDCSSKKRKREVEFKTMDEFYEALQASGCKKENIGKIKEVFPKQDIEVRHLRSLTDEELMRCGIQTLGLRKDILEVLGN